MVKFQNILVADDDKEDYQFLLEGLLRISPEFFVRRAANGLEFLGYLKSFEKPDVIFLDLNMPVRNGIESLKAMKAIPEFQHIPVIVYSTSNFVRDINASYQYGAHYFIEKPTSIGSVVNVLTEVFNRLLANPEKPSKQDFVVPEKALAE
jgi:CheY-like chemotaxis protein